MGNNYKKSEKARQTARKRNIAISSAIAAVAILVVVLLVILQPESDEGEGKMVEIKIKDYGTINVALDEKSAPITVKNFLDLVQKGFYDGLSFHRIISGFMIQGGDPKGNGTGGSGKTIKGEFTANGVNNSIKHTRGVISMARSSSNDSASSQFFIMHADYPSLDGKYAAFGHVTEGIEVVDAICAQAKPGSNGAIAKANQPVIEYIRII